MRNTPSPAMIALGNRVRSISEAQGLSRSMFRIMYCIHINNIDDIENGKSNPELRTLEKLASGFNVPIAELFKEDT